MFSAEVIRKKMTQYPEKFAEINSAFLPAAGALVEGVAKMYAPVDQGELRASIGSKVSGEQAIVSAGAEYATHVEYGTRPHYPPISALKEWAGRVIGDENAAYPIANIIAQRGTKAQPFMRPALDDSRGHIIRKYRDIFRRVFGGK